MRPILIITSCISLFFICCKSTNSPKPDGSENAYQGLAVTWTENSQFPFMAVHENGDAIFLMTEPDGNSPIGAAYVFENGEGFLVWTNQEGYPVRAYVDEHVYLFSNYTNTTVDVAVVNPEGEITISREISTTNFETTPADIPSLNTLDKHLLKTGSNLIPAEFSWAKTLDWTGSVLSVAGCVAASVATGGVALIPCGAAVLNVAVNVYTTVSDDPNEAIEASGAAIGAFGDGVGCATTPSGNIAGILDCAGIFVNTAAAVLHLSEDQMEEEEDRINLASGALEYEGGVIQITLTWNTGADIDLWVTDPQGEKIYWADNTSTSGGYLDVDDINGFGPENIYWEENAPSGLYAVQVHYYGATGDYGVTDFEVFIQTLHDSKVYEGTLVYDEVVDVVSFQPGTSLPKIIVNSQLPKSSSHSTLKESKLSIR